MASESLMKCASCDETETNLYYCNTCGTNEEDSNANQKELLCDICIGSHIRRSHNVKTSKGQLPLVCSVHRNLHSEYCHTCNVTFCQKCLGKHREHKLGSVQDHVTNLKTEVFELLTEFELEEKPLRAKKEAITKINDCHKAEQNDLKDCFTKEMEKLRTDGLDIIEKNCKMSEEKEKMALGAIDLVVDLQLQLRNSLSFEDCLLIQSFEPLKNISVKIKADSEVVTSSNYEFQSCKTGPIERMFQDFRVELLSKMESKLISSEGSLNDSQPVRKRAQAPSIEHFSSGFCPVPPSNCESYKLTIENGELKIHRVVATIFGNVKCMKELLSCQTNEVVKAVFYDIRMTNVIVQTDKELFHVVSAGKPNSWVVKMDHKVENGFICPYFVSGQIQYCYWNRLLKGVVFGHKGALLKSSAIPKLLSFQVGPLVCLLTRDNHIVVCDVEANITHNIPVQFNLLTTVDYVTPYCDFHNQNKKIFHLSVWSIKSKCVARLELQNSGDERNVEEICWTDPTKLLLPNIPEFPRFILLPAIEGKHAESSKTAFQYVYAVLELKSFEQV